MDRVEQVVLLLYGFLSGKVCSHEDLEHIVKNQIMKMEPFKDLTTEEIEEAIYRYEVQYGSRTFEPGITITERKGSDTWLLKKKRKMTNSEHEYQQRYEQYLLLNHYGDDAKESIIKETLSIINFLKK